MTQRLPSLSLLVCAVLLMPFVGTTATAHATDDDPSAETIVQNAEELMRGDSQQGTYRMKVITPDYEREMTFDFWAEGNDKTFIRILEPSRDRGVTYLKLGTEMWNHVPRIDRTVRIPPSMMMQSWMGSNFTNDDLAQASSLVEDYEQELLGRTEVNGTEAFHVELTARPDAAVAWEKLHYFVAVDTFIPLRAEYFDERGDKVRIMRFDEVGEMGGRTIPQVMEVTEPDNPGEKTRLELVDMQFNIDIDASIFTRRNLERSR